MQMEGVRLVVNKGLSNHFQVRYDTIFATHICYIEMKYKGHKYISHLHLLPQVSHTITLSTLGDSGYRFGATFVGSKQTGPAEVSLLVAF